MSGTDGQEPTPEQLRLISLDTLRAFALAESERSSVGDVAVRIGVGRTTLWGFLHDGRKPHPRIRRLLALWYMREAGAMDAHACEALLAAIPADRRPDALANLKAFLGEWRRAHGGGGA